MVAKTHCIFKIPSHIFASIAYFASFIHRHMNSILTSNIFDCLEVDVSSIELFDKKVQKKIVNKIVANKFVSRFLEITIIFSDEKHHSLFASKMSYHEIDDYEIVKNIKKMVNDIISKIDRSEKVRVYMDKYKIKYVNDFAYEKYGLKSFKHFSEIIYIDMFGKFDSDMWYIPFEERYIPLRDVIRVDLENRKEEICGLDEYRILRIQEIYHEVCDLANDYDSMAEWCIDYYSNS